MNEQMIESRNVLKKSNCALVDEHDDENACCNFVESDQSISIFVL
jgi:hypothetical protein